MRILSDKGNRAATDVFKLMPSLKQAEIVLRADLFYNN
jgi:hypothetical protein